MRISELSAASAVSVGTIKFYLREGLLPPGERTSRTTADYGPEHLERLQLIRALIDHGGLGIGAVRRVVAAIEAPEPPRLDLMATAQGALIAARSGAAEEGAEEGSEHPPAEPGRADAWLAARGWRCAPDDPLLGLLRTAWDACASAGVEVDEAMMDGYAEAALQIARVDVAAVPPGGGATVRRVVVGTVMIDPLLSVLRLLAQREVSVEVSPGASASGSGIGAPPATRG